MKRKILLGTAGAAVVAAGFGLLAGPKPAARAEAHGARRPVIVELFTSEACSDCPAADALATRLKRTQPVGGAQVIVLGQHVDYWNDARWSDRFSQRAFTDRQVDYTNHLHPEGPYTPEIIVDGRTDELGSDQDGVERAIAADARLPKADVRLARAGDSVSVHIDHLPAVESDVVLAVTEDGLHTRVGGGENAGRYLEHSAVVRSLRVVGTLRGASSAGFDVTVPVSVPPGWRRENLQAVVFVQARASRHILGAASVPLT